MSITVQLIHMFLLLILYTVCRTVVCDTFHIISAPDDSCPAPLGQCYTLQQYADSPNVTGFNITLDLQPGNHSLTSVLMLTMLNDITNFHMTSTNGSVVCSGEDKETRGRLSLSGIQSVYIEQLTFIDCYNNQIMEIGNFIAEDSTFLKGNFTAWQFLDITNIVIQRCLFSLISSTALFFQDRESSSVTVKNCNFTSNGAYVGTKGGNFGGAIHSYSTIAIETSNFIDNQAFVKGGAVCVQYSPVFITGCNFTHNKAQIIGGALCVLETGGLITQSNFIENVVTDSSTKCQGGALYYRILSSGLPLELHYSTFSGNTAELAGGAFYVYSKFNVTSTNLIFRNNSATAGGAISFYKNNPVVILSLINCTFIDNTAIVRSRNRLGLPSVVEIGSGGALIVRGGLRCFGSNFTRNSAEVHAGVVHMSNSESHSNNFYSERCIFTNNSARGGIGGVYHCRLRHTIAHIVDSTFFGNTALHCGVAYASIYNNGYVNNITIESSLFMYNNAVDNTGDGGVLCVRYSTVSIKCGGFSYNTAAQNGGVIHMNQSSINVLSSSFTNNAAVNDGGALFIINNSEGEIEDSLFSYNTAESRGGALYVSSSGLQISTTNFFGNRAGSIIGANIADCNNRLFTVDGIANQTDSCTSYTGDIQHYPITTALQCPIDIFGETEIISANTTKSAHSSTPTGQ